MRALLQRVSQAKVVVDGKVLMKERRFLTIDVERVRAEATALAAKIQAALAARLGAVHDPSAAFASGDSAADTVIYRHDLAATDRGAA